MKTLLSRSKKGRLRGIGQLDEEGKLRNSSKKDCLGQGEWRRKRKGWKRGYKKRKKTRKKQKRAINGDRKRKMEGNTKRRRIKSPECFWKGL